MESEIAAETSEAEYNEFQFKQLQDAKLVVGELEELEEEQKRLANAEEIKTMLNSTSALLNPYDTSLVQHRNTMHPNKYPNKYNSLV